MPAWHVESPRTGWCTVVAASWIWRLRRTPDVSENTKITQGESLPRHPGRRPRECACIQSGGEEGTATTQSDETHIFSFACARERSTTWAEWLYIANKRNLRRERNGSSARLWFPDRVGYGPCLSLSQTPSSRRRATLIQSSALFCFSP